MTCGYVLPAHIRCQNIAFHFLLRTPQRNISADSAIFNRHSVLISAYDGKLDNQTKEHFYINPVYLTTIVAGSAGSKEEISSGSAPKKDLAKYIEEYGSVQSP